MTILGRWSRLFAYDWIFFNRFLEHYVWWRHAIILKTSINPCEVSSSEVFENYISSKRSESWQVRVVAVCHQEASTRSSYFNQLVSHAASFYSHRTVCDYSRRITSSFSTFGLGIPHLIAYWKNPYCITCKARSIWAPIVVFLRSPGKTIWWPLEAFSMLTFRKTRTVSAEPLNVP